MLSKQTISQDSVLSRISGLQSQCTLLLAWPSLELLDNEEDDDDDDDNDDVGERDDL